MRLNSVTLFLWVCSGLGPSNGAGQPGSRRSHHRAQHTASLRWCPRPPPGPPRSWRLLPPSTYHRGPAGYEPDRVLHLLLRHLHHAAVLLLRGKGLLPILGHPGVQLWRRGRGGSGPGDRHRPAKDLGIPPAVPLRVQRPQAPTQHPHASRVRLPKRENQGLYSAAQLSPAP